ncbi:hypothetical protein [Engelhardtia mirabilis]|uniref:hypothetical protein n=1 Tax=Engelhardtia mirabilis TaxID=2528011 RepID=UPI0011A9442E
MVLLAALTIAVRTWLGATPVVDGALWPTGGEADARAVGQLDEALVTLTEPALPPVQDPPVRAPTERWGDRTSKVIGLPSDPIIEGVPLLRPDPNDLADKYRGLSPLELQSAYEAVSNAYEIEVESEFERLESNGLARVVPMPVYDGDQEYLRGLPITANRYRERIVRCWQSTEDRNKLVELVIDPAERPEIYDLEFEKNWLMGQLLTQSTDGAIVIAGH